MKILPRHTWTTAVNGRAGRPLSKTGTTSITLHYPGAPGAIGILSMASLASRLRGYRRLHVEDRGWADIGYNYVVDQAGRIIDLTGNNVGAHAGGSGVGNRTSIAILCLVGNTETPSSALIGSVRWLRQHLLKTFKNATAVRPHSYWTSTGCPGDKLRRLIKDGVFTSTPTRVKIDRWHAVRFLNVKGNDDLGKRTFKDRLAGMVEDLTDGLPEVIGLCELRPEQEKLMTRAMSAEGYRLVRYGNLLALYVTKAVEVGPSDVAELPTQHKGATEALLRARLKVRGHWNHYGVTHLDYRDGFDAGRVRQAKDVVASMRRFGLKHLLTPKSRHVVMGDMNSRTWVLDQAFQPAAYDDTRNLASTKRNVGETTLAPRGPGEPIDYIITGKHRPTLSVQHIWTKSDHPIIDTVLGKKA